MYTVFHILHFLQILIFDSIVIHFQFVVYLYNYVLVDNL